MDLNFVEPEQIPVPAEKVRVLDAQSAPYPDRRRVRVSVKLTPFLEHPDVELRIVDEAGETIAEASVIECQEPEFDLTLHIRQPPGANHASLHVTVHYPDRALEHSLSRDFTLPPSG